MGIPLGNISMRILIRKKETTNDHVAWCFRPASRTHNLPEILSTELLGGERDQSTTGLQVKVEHL